MKKPFGLVVASCVLAMVAMSGRPSAQSTSPLFSTTFNCPDWRQSLGLADVDVCALGDGIAGAGAWTTSAGSEDMITLAANRPGGGGGKGFRHWRGDGYNNDGGGLAISLPIPVNKMSVRFYMRYQAGFTWAAGHPGGTKETYWKSGTGSIYFGFSGGVLRFVANGLPYNSSITWNDIMGGSTGDGLWHVYDYFVQTDTNGTNGLGKIWVDGKLVFDRNDLNWHNGTWQSFLLGSNQETPANGKDNYTDYDDITVTAGSLTTIAFPAAPTNVHIMR
jgi:hypothetical protein